MKKQFVLLFAALLTSTIAFAHGEDKPGPHNGFIRMPGAFHTEVVAKGNSELHVYLLDIAWKNPLVKDSSVAASVKTDTTVKAACVPSKDFFICTFPKSVNLASKAQLLIQASRNGQPGALVSYPLPLSLGTKGHEGH